MQVAAAAVGPKGRVVGVDLEEVSPPLDAPNASALVGDFGDVQLRGQILAALGGRARVVLSDAAPKLTGIRMTDRANEERLLEAIESLLPELLAPGGDLLVEYRNHRATRTPTHDSWSRSPGPSR